MGKVIDFGKRDQLKLPERFCRQEYILLPGKNKSIIDGMPRKNKIPAGAEITVHTGNKAHLFVNDQLIRVMALSARELREALLINAGKILRFRYEYSSLNNVLQFKSFLKTVSFYVNRLEAVVFDNLGMRCWLPQEWLRAIDGGPFDYRNHLTVHSVLEKEPGRYWVHTHGMVQFACPDLEVRMVSPEGKGMTLQLLSWLTDDLINHNGSVFKEGCRKAITKGGCWITLKHHGEMPWEDHYQNNYFRVLVMSKELGGRQEGSPV